ncbi:ATP-dependent sacrificial sulfur transferase LarE [Candidatus Desantisbacteria bacterium]|nr:ATP-dependent sacrificial sulfur transferase LarE [Candidatus Desantisbacteria bacterium]
MDKFKKLREILKNMESLLVAYSGGVDSTFLLKSAFDTLGDRVLAVTAESDTYTAEELEDSRKIASDIGVRHIIIHTEELKNEKFVSNPPDRCYYCKKELFTKLLEIAKINKINFVADGTNFDDINDYRPGMKAALEFGIRSPLKEAGFTKNEIREYSKKLGLSTWNKPGQACLSSRFPYGENITPQKLGIVSSAENFLHELGFSELRVRYYSPALARIELNLHEQEKLYNSETRVKILTYFKKLGFNYITLDLEGYRTGSMNEVLGYKT